MMTRVALGLGLSSVSFALTFVGRIVLVPVLVFFWGAQVYGEWVSLTNIAHSLTLLNLGVQSYTLNLLVDHYEKENFQQGTQVLQATLRLYTIFLTLASVILLVLVLSPDLAEQFNIFNISSIDARLILLMQGAWVVYNLLGGVLFSILIVIKQHPRRLVYGMISSSILLFAPMTVAILGGEPLLAALASFTLLLIASYFQFRDVWQRTPFQIGIRQTSWSLARSLIGPSLSFFGVRLTSMMLTSLLVVVLATNRGGVEVALYTTTLMMSNVIRSLFNQFMNILWPEITRFSSDQDYERLAKLHRFALKVSLGFIGILTAFLIVFGEEILFSWTTGNIQPNTALNTTLALYLLVQAPTLVSRTVGLATNQQNELLWIEFPTALLTLILSMILVPELGAFGLGLALLLGQLINTPLLSWRSCWWIREKASHFLQQIIPIFGIVVIMNLWSIWLLFSGISSFGQLSIFAIVTLIAIFLSWHVSLSEKEKLTIIYSSKRVYIKVSSLLSPHSPQ